MNDTCFFFFHFLLNSSDEKIEKLKAMTSLAHVLVLAITLICQWNLSDKLTFAPNGFFVSFLKSNEIRKSGINEKPVGNISHSLN